MSQTQQQIRKAVKNLISSPTTFNPSSPGNNHPFSNTTDLYSQYEYLFNEEAKVALSTRANNMVFEYLEKIGPSTLYEVTALLEKLGLKSAQDNPFSHKWMRKYVLVMCFGFICQVGEVDDASKELITQINRIALNKQIKASLYNIGRMDLYGGEECVVFSYLAIPSEHEEDVKKSYNRIQFPEGGIPPRFKHVIV